MKAYRLLLAMILGFSLSACSTSEVDIAEDATVTENTTAAEETTVCEVCTVCEECLISPFPEGLVLPQIYILGKLHWSTADLDGLNTNIIEPIVAYFEAENQTVVSISVKTEDLSKASINTISVEVIVSDNDGNQDPLYMGILIEKVSGVFPIWEPETME